MKTSCGVIILNDEKELFMGHSTGNKFFDIPKGLLEENEVPMECAIRECLEETSINLSNIILTDLGVFPYNKEKNLHLFACYLNKATINLEQLKCESFFEDFYTKKLKPEVDYFKWVSLEEIVEHSAKSMGKLLMNLKNSGLLDVEKYKNNKRIKNEF